MELLCASCITTLSWTSLRFLVAKSSVQQHGALWFVVAAPSAPITATRVEQELEVKGYTVEFGAKFSS